MDAMHFILHGQLMCCGLSWSTLFPPAFALCIPGSNMLWLERCVCFTQVFFFYQNSYYSILCTVASNHTLTSKDHFIIRLLFTYSSIIPPSELHGSKSRTATKYSSEHSSPFSTPFLHCSSHFHLTKRRASASGACDISWVSNLCGVSSARQSF